MQHGRYELLERLGEGEAAVVYRARDLAASGRTVALKVLKGAAEGDAARFRREFEVLAGLRHPNLVSVIDFGVSADGSLYYSAEHDPGQETLRSVLSTGQRFATLAERVELLVVVLRALEYVHTRGVIHRDLKPDNVLIAPDGGVRLSDFGLVGAREDQAAGTPHYMAPEAIRRLRVDRRCDLYSLGVLAYELLTGRLPYEGDARAVARKHLDDRPRPLRELDASVPAALERVVLRLLAKEPSHRYSSANAVIAALSEACHEPFAFETSATKQAYVLSGKHVGRDREIDWLTEGFQRATGAVAWDPNPRHFDRRARFATGRGGEARGERRRGGDRRANAPTGLENPPALMVFLRGASGVGKTRLLDELRRRCQLEGAVVLRGSCRKHLARGYEPFISVIQEAVQLAGPGAEGGDPELRAAEWAVSQLLAQAEGGSVSEELRGVERLRFLDALAELLVARSTRRPILLELENVQWARGETLELLRHLYRTLVALHSGATSGAERPKLFVVASYRPEEIHGPELGHVLQELRHDRFFEQLGLGPLEADDTSELIRSMLGVPQVPRAFVGRVMEATRGNPLFVQLLMEELVERGAIDRKRGLWRLDPARLRKLELPARVQDLVAARVERVAERELLEWLAVVDRAGAPGFVAELSGREREAVARGLETLVGSRWLERVGGRYAFAHARVRDAVYAGVSERGLLHGRVAEALERALGLGETVSQAELAHHLLEAGAGLEASRRARAAADAVAGLGALERACELYARALRVADDRIALAGRAAPELVEEKLLLLRALVDGLEGLERHAEARGHALSELRLARELEDAQAEVVALGQLGRLNARLQEGEDAKRFFCEALQKAERLDYGKGIGLSLLGLGDLTLDEGRLAEATEYLERSLAFEQDLGDEREIAGYLRALATAFQRQGRLDEALEACGRALEHDRDGRDRANRIASLELLAELHFVRGAFEEAVEAGEQALAVAGAAEDKAAEARSLLALGSALERQGERGEARRRFGEALGLTRRLGLEAELAQAQNSLGWMHQQAGELDEALSAFNEATTRWNVLGDREGYALGLKNLGLCYGQRGELSRAGQCYEAAVRVAWEIGSKQAELEAGWGHAEVLRALGEGERAREALDKAVLKARELKRPWLEALALADLGSLLAACGEGARGRRAVRRARALAEEHGDAGARARVQLRAAEVDLAGGALAPALEALRARGSWLRPLREPALALEGELVAGEALARVGDAEGAREVLDSALAGARARGFRVLEARACVALGALQVERRRVLGGAVASAAGGEARAALEAGARLADALGAQRLTQAAILWGARDALCAGETERVGELLAELGEHVSLELRVERQAVADALRVADDPAGYVGRAGAGELDSPWLRLREALLRVRVAERQGQRLEARGALEDAERARRTLEAGLGSEDRRRLARTADLVELIRALERWEEAAGAGAVAAEQTPQAEAPAAKAERERLWAFLSASRELQRQTSSEAVLRRLLDRSLALFGAERGLVVELNAGGEQRVLAARKAGGQDLPADEQRTSSSIVAHVAETGALLVLPDAQDDLELSERPSVVDLDLRSLLAVPLAAGSREGTGTSRAVLVLEDREAAGRFHVPDRELAETLAELAGGALERARLREAAAQRESQLEAQAREVARLEAELQARVAEQSHELDAVKAALKGRDYELGLQSSYANIVGRSEPMRQVFRLLEKVAGSDVPLLVQGESGTGKELVARAVHFNGPRKDKPFLSINVAALPESLLESELFGHVKGAFTGADRDKQGLFEAAHEGTLFLDEVGDMPPAMQTKLLRVLQEGEVRPIGTRVAKKVRVRVVSASNKDLRQLVEAGQFRADLFYRLNVVSLALPALRERKEDIPLLVDHLLDKIAERSGEKRKSVDRKVIDHLIHYDWPGNVRELENELRRLVALSGMRVTERDLSSHIRRKAVDRLELPIPQEEGLTLKEQIERVERRFLIEALRANENNKTRTAKVLGLSRYGFLKKLDKYRLREEGF